MYGNADRHFRLTPTQGTIARVEFAESPRGQGVARARLSIAPPLSVILLRALD